MGEIIKNVVLGRLGGGLYEEEYKHHVRARQSKAHLFRLLDKPTPRGRGLHSTIYTE